MNELLSKLRPALIVPASFLIAGCAYTSIEKTSDGEFRYISTRDSMIEEMHLTRRADGSLELHVNGAVGTASTVIDAQREFLGAVIEAAFAAGARSMRPVR